MSDNEKKNIEDINLFDKLFREEMMEIDEDALLRSARSMFAFMILPRSDN